MALCKGCQRFRNGLFVPDAGKGRVVIHENFAELSKCADTFCGLCQFIRRELHYYTSRVDKYRLRFYDEDFKSVNSEISVQFDKEQGDGFCFYLGDRACPRIPYNIATFTSDTPSVTSTINHVRGQNPSLETLLDLSRRWLTTCCAEHKECGPQTGIESAYLPTRLLDVGEQGQQTIRLVHSKDISDKHTAEYVTLSYCWGRRDDAACTTKQNMAERLTAIGVNTLPKTLQDAVVITQAFGVRYLWIDALCIIQVQKGENEDWQREHPFMGKIYRHSLFTIAASGAKNSSVGCFRRREAAAWPVQDYQLVGEEKTDALVDHIVLKATLPDWMVAVEKSVLAQRGWVMQERMLALRTLFWTDDGLFWSCKGMKASECETNPPYFAWKYFSLDELVDRVKSRGRESKHAWPSVLENFSGKALTIATDKLPAVAGLGNEVARLAERQYEMGVFKDNLVQELAWMADFYVSENFSNDPPAARLPGAPSWSWASTHQKLKFRLRTSERYWDYEELVSNLSLDGHQIHVRSRLGRLDVKRLDKTVLLRADMAYHATPCTFRPIRSGFSEAAIDDKKEIAVFDILADTLQDLEGTITCLQWMKWTDGCKRSGEGQDTQYHAATGALIVTPVDEENNTYRRLGWVEVVDGDFFEDQPRDIILV